MSARLILTVLALVAFVFATLISADVVTASDDWFTWQTLVAAGLSLATAAKLVKS